MRMNTAMNPARSAADNYLTTLLSLKSRLSDAEARAQVEMENVRARYEAEVAGLKIEYKAQGKQLVKLMKQQTGDIFDGRDRVDLAHGSLLHSIERRVKRARGVLGNLKKLKIVDAIKVVESVDWDKLEKWPVEKLVLVGTERIREEQYSYELNNS